RRVRRWGMRVRVFPFDSDFPSLTRFADPSSISTLLPAVVRPSASVVAVRYRPGERHVLRYTSSASHADPGARTVFAKLHREAEAASGRTAAVADWLAGEGCHVAALRPLRVLPWEQAAVY